ncbi:MAG: NAD-dependent epimerase/dehydratase family protein [Flavobacteriales bacterium]|nr:NAD-dependent epimerase/dehydratase family protein [Flavobacteriales bacterium]
MKKILVLGGTNFIGRNLLTALTHEDYDVTLFNRGKTNPHIGRDLNFIKGDRETSDIKQVFDINWDVIVDLSCYYPKSLADIVNGLKGNPHYIFISTCSVYDHSKQVHLRSEDAPTLSCNSKQYFDQSPQSYGNRKAECERILVASPFDYTIFRPAMVFGEHDPTDRLYFWVHKIKNNVDLLLPEGGLRTFSMTYVKDLVSAISEKIVLGSKNEIINAISFPKTSILNIVEALTKELDIHPKRKMISLETLQDQNISEWFDFPLWLSNDYFTYSNDRFSSLLKQGTTLERSLKETLAYFRKMNWPEPTYGMDSTRYLNLVNQ